MSKYQINNNYSCTVENTVSQKCEKIQQVQHWGRPALFHKCRQSHDIGKGAREPDGR